ncbi:hypothetical protein D3C80_1367100 [compost metagenome]
MKEHAKPIDRRNTLCLRHLEDGGSQRHIDDIGYNSTCSERRKINLGRFRSVHTQ